MKKKIIIIASIVAGVLLLLALGLFLLFYFRGNNKITITFDSNGGSKVESIKVKKGEKVSLPIPTKEGYGFVGWFDEDGKQITLYWTKFLTKDTTLKAKWKEAEGEEITITFDTDGGTPVESITIVKGSLIDLPVTSKDGFTFEGWYNDVVEITKESVSSLKEDTTLKAKWSEVKAADKTMTINFDANGGIVSGNNSKTSQMVVKCTNDSYTVESLPTASKDGYKFVAWADKHGKVILSGAKLTCGNITLYADFEKKDTAKPDTPPVTKQYKCPEGYELKDTNKCVQTANANLACDSNWKLINGECFNPSVDTKTREGNRTCPEKTINGWTGTGYYYEAGRGYCAYYEMPSYTGANQQCANAGGHIIPGNSYKCFKYVGYEYAMSCASGTKYVEAQAFGGGSNPGCYYYKAANKVCPDGYTNASVYGECAKVIDATLE